MKHTLSVALSLFPLLIASVAAVPVKSQPRETVPANLFGNFRYVAQYAAAAYCNDNTNKSPRTKLTCAKGNCPLVEEADTTTLIEFSRTPSTDTSGFVALDRTNRLIVLSFRGTQSVTNAATGLLVGLADSSICRGCQVHTGFLNGWNEIRAEVLRTIDDALARNPSYHIIATGHSLGGALAELAAAVIRNTRTPVALYTFGAPRVGNAAFSNYVSRQLGGNYRVVNADDGVPNLPPAGLGYTHILPEFLITNSRNYGLGVRPADIEVIQQSNLLAGHAAAIPIRVGAHYGYFGEITACGTGFSI